MNRKADLWRIDGLRNIDVKVKFVSFEPLLENLGEDINLDGVSWVIVGAQTRPEKQPDHRWVASLTKQAMSRDIPVFLKNNLSDSALDETFGVIQEFPKV